MSAFTTQAFTDVIIILFAFQLLFQTHYVLKVVKEVADALEIRVLCVKHHYPEANDSNKIVTTTGLEKPDDNRIAAHRLANTDTNQNESSGDHSIEGPEGLEEATEDNDNEADGGSSKLIS
jgi:hypothetical protein